MPIYEYKCQICDYNTESLQKVTDKPLITCPNCGKDQLIKLLSNTSFQLKGTGWYVTDFKDKPKVKDKTTDTVKKDSEK